MAPPIDNQLVRSTVMTGTHGRDLQWGSGWRSCRTDPSPVGPGAVSG